MSTFKYISITLKYNLSKEYFESVSKKQYNYDFE